MGRYNELIKWLQAQYAFKLSSSEEALLESWLEKNAEELLSSDSLEVEILGYLSSAFPNKRYRLVEDDNSNDLYILNLIKKGLGK